MGPTRAHAVSIMVDYSTSAVTDLTTRQWLLSITIALCGLLLMLLYEASMTYGLPHSPVETSPAPTKPRSTCNETDESTFYRCGSASLVKQSVASDFRSLEDFERCRIPDTDICFVGGDGIQTFWENSMTNRYGNIPIPSVVPLHFSALF